MRGLAAVLCLWLGSPAAAFGPFGDAQAYREARALYDAGKYSEVIERLSGAGMRSIRRGERPRAHELLGASYERTGELQKAIAVYQFAAGLYPKDINILSNQANLLHRMDLDDRARPLYERVLEMHPNNAFGHRGLAEIFRAQGLHAEACDHYALALREHHRDHNLWRSYAEALADRRDFISAERAVQRALSIEEDAESRLDLADFQRAMRKPEAYASLDRAGEAAGAREDIRLRRALWLLEDGRLDESLREAESVLSAHADEPLALWLRASIRIRRGSEAGAREDLAKAAQAERDSPFIARVSKALLDRR